MMLLSEYDQSTLMETFCENRFCLGACNEIKKQAGIREDQSVKFCLRYGINRHRLDYIDDYDMDWGRSEL